MKFKLEIVLYIAILAFCHQASSDSLSNNLVSKLKDAAITKGFEKSTAYKGNNYYQASEQIFNVYLNPTSKLPNIPSDYQILSGIRAVKFHSEKVTWNDARNLCIKEGAHLSIIRSNEERNYLKEIQQKHKVNSLWMGIHSLIKAGEWVTIHDEPFGSIGNFTTWRAGEPNNLGGNERCVELIIPNAQKSLNDLSCTGLNSFYCKIELEPRK